MLLYEQKNMMNKRKKILILSVVIYMLVNLFTLQVFAATEDIMGTYNGGDDISATDAADRFYNDWLAHYGEKGENIIKDKDKVSESIQKQVKNYFYKLNGISKGSATKDANEVDYSETFEATKEQLKLDPGGKGLFGQIWVNVAVRVYANITSTIGVLMLVIIWLIQLLDMVTSERFNPEEFFKMLIKLVVAVYIIEEFPNLFEMVLKAFNSFLEDLSNFTIPSSDEAATTSGRTFVTFDDAISDSDVRADLKGFAENYKSKLGGILASLSNLTNFGSGIVSSTVSDFIRVIGHPIISVIVFLTATTRMIQIPLWYMMAPIGLASIVKDGSRGPGFRYIRKLLALLLQGALIMICLNLFTAIVTAKSYGFAGIFAPIVGGVVMISIIKATSDMADRMMDSR